MNIDIVHNLLAIILFALFYSCLYFFTLRFISFIISSGFFSLRAHTIFAWYLIHFYTFFFFFHTFYYNMRLSKISEKKEWKNLKSKVTKNAKKKLVSFPNKQGKQIIPSIIIIKPKHTIPFAPMMMREYHLHHSFVIKRVLKCFFHFEFPFCVMRYWISCNTSRVEWNGMRYIQNFTGVKSIFLLPPSSLPLTSFACIETWFFFSFSFILTFLYIFIAFDWSKKIYIKILLLWTLYHNQNFFIHLKIFSQKYTY